MMLSKEELLAFTKLASQNAWRRETATTVNAIVEDVVFQVCEKLLEEIEKLHTRLESSYADMLELVPIKNKPIKGSKIHAS